MSTTSISNSSTQLGMITSPLKQSETTSTSISNSSSAAESASTASHSTLLPNSANFLIISHPIMRQDEAHNTKTNEEHQESADRIRQIWSFLLSTPNLQAYLFEPEISPFLMQEWQTTVLCVHSTGYVEKLRSACEEARRVKIKHGTESLPLSPKLLVSGKGGATRISSQSLDTAIMACALVGDAVRWALERTSHQQQNPRRAFCLVRPPGHHACPDGPSERVGGCGFCLINTVAVVAAHVQSKGWCQRIAVVDLDVHHGNGTEECLLRLGAGCLYASVHLLETFENSDLDFFPGTGFASESGSPLPIERNSLKETSGCITVNCPLSPLWNKKSSRGCLRGRMGFRKAISEQIMPSLQAFNPQLILVSAGFDGALGDVGNTSELQKPGLDLTPGDFEWVARELTSLNLPLVSVLEGGYGQFSKNGFDRSTLVNGAVSFIQGLLFQNFFIS